MIKQFRDIFSFLVIDKQTPVCGFKWININDAHVEKVANKNQQLSTSGTYSISITRGKNWCYCF